MKYILIKTDFEHSIVEGHTQALESISETADL